MEQSILRSAFTWIDTFSVPVVDGPCKILYALSLLKDENICQKKLNRYSVLVIFLGHSKQSQVTRNQCDQPRLFRKHGISYDFSKLRLSRWFSDAQILIFPRLPGDSR